MYVLNRPLQICLLLALTWVSQSIAAGEEIPRELTRAASKSGLNIEAAKRIPIEDTNRAAWVGGCKNETGVYLCLFHEQNRVFTLEEPLVPTGGDRLHKLQLMDLTPRLPGPEIVLEVYSENPDEKIKRLRVYTLQPKPREIFFKVIFRLSGEPDIFNRLPQFKLF